MAGVGGHLRDFHCTMHLCTFQLCIVSMRLAGKKKNNNKIHDLIKNHLVHIICVCNLSVFYVYKEGSNSSCFKRWLEEWRVMVCIEQLACVLGRMKLTSSYCGYYCTCCLGVRARRSGREGEREKVFCL